MATRTSHALHTQTRRHHSSHESARRRHSLESVLPILSGCGTLGACTPPCRWRGRGRRALPAGQRGEGPRRAASHHSSDAARRQGRRRRAAAACWRSRAAVGGARARSGRAGASVLPKAQCTSASRASSPVLSAMARCGSAARLQLLPRRSLILAGRHGAWQRTRRGACETWAARLEVACSRAAACEARRRPAAARRSVVRTAVVWKAAGRSYAASCSPCWRSECAAQADQRTSMAAAACVAASAPLVGLRAARRRRWRCRRAFPTVQRCFR